MRFWANIKQKVTDNSSVMSKAIKQASAHTLLVIGLFFAYVAVDAAILTVLWPEVMPDLFPMAVENGYVVKEVDFHSIFLACLALVVLRPVNMSQIFPKKGE